MRNLDQIRAAAALEPSKTLSRSAVNKLPAMILTNGLLATAAFCDADGGGENRGGMKAALAAAAVHLSARGLLADGTNTIRGMIEQLSRGDSSSLQLATAEALAFLAFAKRFAPKD